MLWGGSVMMPFVLGDTNFVTIILMKHIISPQTCMDWIGACSPPPFLKNLTTTFFHGGFPKLYYSDATQFLSINLNKNAKK